MKFAKTIFEKYVQPLLDRYDLALVRKNRLPPDFEPVHAKIWKQVAPYTMTSPERIYTLIEAVRYVVKSGIPGAFVECGVWRGGSAMAMTASLLECGNTAREVYLYDTFAGMSVPTQYDVNLVGKSAQEKHLSTLIGDGVSNWALSPIDEVKANVSQVPYPASMIHFVQGKVEDTIPVTIPEQISLLRLDTDWYESTKHELEHLFPRLAPNGVIIIDDYGHWQGSRKAVDEYFTNKKHVVLLNRVDYSCRLGIKTN